MVRLRLDLVLILCPLPLILGEDGVHLQLVSVHLVQVLDTLLRSLVGGLVRLILRLFPCGETLLRLLVDVLGDLVKSLQETVRRLLADLLPCLLDLRFLAPRPGDERVRHGLPGLEILLEGDTGFHLILECLGRLTESLDPLLPEYLDGLDDTLERSDDELKDGVAHAHHPGDDLLDESVGCDELRHLPDEVSEPSGKGLHDVGQEVHDRLQSGHRLLESRHGGLVVLEFPGELDGHGHQDAEGGDERGLGDPLHPVLDTVQTASDRSETLAETIHMLRQIPKGILDGIGIIAHIPLEIALQGIHVLELVIDRLDLTSQVSPPRRILR